jgi:hypothetical protein
VVADVRDRLALDAVVSTGALWTIAWDDQQKSSPARVSLSHPTRSDRSKTSACELR